MHYPQPTRHLGGSTWVHARLLWVVFWVSRLQVKNQVLRKVKRGRRRFRTPSSAARVRYAPPFHGGRDGYGSISSFSAPSSPFTLILFYLSLGVVVVGVGARAGATEARCRRRGHVDLRLGWRSIQILGSNLGEVHVSGLGFHALKQ